MKFDEYITEVDKRSLTRDHIFNVLKMDCQPFIKELQKSGNEVLWRGTRGHSKPLTKITPRKDRIPTDTPQEVQDELDKRFKKRFGWRARGEGVFATSSRVNAGDYGIIYMFFPIGKYQYVYNPRVEDLWRELEGDYIDILDSYENSEDILADWEEKYDFDYGPGESGSWWYEGGDTGEVDIDSAVIAAAEAEGYDEDEINPGDLEWEPDVKWEDYKKDQFEELYDEAEGQLDSLISGYRNTNLKLAISTAVEIQFKCKNYYLVDQQYSFDIEESLLRGKTK